MTNHISPKLESFRALVQQADSLHAELTSLETATRQRDDIKARISECQDESAAHGLLDELTRAESVVTLKCIREPRIRADLDQTLIEAKHVFHTAHSELRCILEKASTLADEGFRSLLADVLSDTDKAEEAKARDITIGGTPPMVLVKKHQENLQAAWRHAELVAADAPARLKGLQSALVVLDRIIVAQPEIADKTKKLATACAAFLKAYSKR